jgi:signal transduction histidine kinase
LWRALLDPQPVRLGDREVFVPLQIGGAALGVLGALQNGAMPGSSQTEADGLHTEDVDLRVLTIVASQVSASLRSDHALRRGERPLAQAEGRYKADARAVLSARGNRDLLEARNGLDLARQRQLLENERHRLASELHDSVTQHVLAAGMAIDWCRAEVPPGSAVREHLEYAKRLTRTAVEQLRSSIEALGPHRANAAEDLPGMLRQLQTFGTAKHFDLSVHVVGRRVPLSAAAKQSLFRIASECLFNAAAHAGGRRVVIRLEYGSGTLRLSVADDGSGQPQVLRKILQREIPGTGGGYHRGLVDIGARVAELGGTIDVGRSHLGGIRTAVVVPLAPLLEYDDEKTAGGADASDPHRSRR